MANYEKSEEMKEEMKSELDICEVVQDLTDSSLKRAGTGSYKMLCPFHKEKTPSFNVNPERLTYHCFGCGKGGDVYQFVQEQKGFSFPKTLSFLANTYLPNSKFSQFYSGPKQNETNGLDLIINENIEYNLNAEDTEQLFKIMNLAQDYFVSELKTNTSSAAQEARAYLKNKGLDSMVDEVGVGFAPQNDFVISYILNNFNEQSEKETFEQIYKAGLIRRDGIFRKRITFPIKTGTGQVVAFTARAITTEKVKNKYRNSPNNQIFSKKEMLLGLENINPVDIERHGLYLVEGNTDTYPFLKQGLKCALAVGSTSFNEYHLGILSTISPDQIYFAFDSDPAGILGAIKSANIARSINNLTDINMIQLPLEEDPFSLFFEQGIDIKKYTKENSFPPKEFFKKNIPIINSDYFKDSRERKNFLKMNTSNIISFDEIADLGLDIEEQEWTQSKPKYTNPIIFNESMLSQPLDPKEWEPNEEDLLFR